MALTYEPIATTTLGSTSNTITFSSIPSTYTDLRLVISSLLVGGAGEVIRLRFNGVSTTTYSATTLTGNGSSAGTNNTTNVNGIYGTRGFGGTESMVIFDIFSYAGSTHKTVLGNYSQDYNGSGVTESLVGLWRSTSAITSVSIVTIVETMGAGTTATLYGIKAA